jgi:hypothetical protein
MNLHRCGPEKNEQKQSTHHEAQHQKVGTREKVDHGWLWMQ